MTEHAQDEKAVFLAALERTSREARDAFLAEACAGDPERLERLRLLLRTHEVSLGPLDSPPHDGDPTAFQPVAEKPGDNIGPYKLLQQIGEGGMGVVYMAEQTEPLERRVALKIIKPGMDTRQVIARFEAERQALAMMDHPNIAKVLDAGTTETGRPFFVMELVKGVPITQYCDEHRLTPRERLKLFMPVCQAIQHAHQKGIIHRDIKPSNVLVAHYDDQAVPKVIDFGVAKAINHRLTEKTMFTEFGQVLGTIEYMSPEQARLNQWDVDTRTDIYSLGVLLYELLSGETPFDRERMRSVAFDELLRIIREEEPPRPSTRASGSETLPTIAANRQTGPKELTATIHGELDWIVMKALEKDRTRRYETASKFVEDLQHFLAGDAVEACPPSATYRLRKFAQRNKPVIATLTAVAAALLLGTGVATWQWMGAIEDRNLARAAESAAAEQARRADAATAAAVTAENQARTALKTAERDRDHAVQLTDELRLRAYVADMGLAFTAIEEGDPTRARTLLTKHFPEEGENDLRGFEWRYLWNCSQSNYDKDLGPQISGLSAVAISPDARFAAFSRRNPSRLEIHHLPSGTLAKSIPTAGDVSPIAYSASGDFLVGFMGWNTGKLASWDTRTWAAREPLPLGRQFAFSHRTDDEFFVAVEGDHLSLWDAKAWEKIADLPNDPSMKMPFLQPPHGTDWHFVSALAVSSDDRVVYMAAHNEIRRWDLEARKPLPSFNLPWTQCLATSADGQLAASDIRGQVHLLDPSDGQVLHSFDSHLSWMSGLRFSRSGDRLVSSSADQTILVYDPRQSSITGRLHGLKSDVRGLDISADAQTVVAAGGSGNDHVLTWKLSDVEADGYISVDEKILGILSDGRISIQRDGADDLEFYSPLSRSHEPAGVKPIVSACKQSGGRILATSPNAEWAVSNSEDGLVCWNLFTGNRQHLLPPDSGGGYEAKFSPDSQTLALKTHNRDSPVSVRAWRTADWSSQELFSMRSVTALGAGVSGNSKYLAIAAWGRPPRIIDIGSGFREVLFGAEIPLKCLTVSLSRTGRWLAVGVSGDGIHIWDVEKATRVRVLPGQACDLAFSPDERTLVSTTGRITIFWHVPTWERMFALRGRMLDSGRTGSTHSYLEFSPDGQYLICPTDKVEARHKLLIASPVAAPGETAGM